MPAVAAPPTRSISLVGVISDRPNLEQLGIGRDGSWFPAFGLTGDAVEGAPTSAGARDDLPAWVAAFNHTTGPTDPGCTTAVPDDLARGCLPTYAFRTFSQDGPARAASDPTWARLRLPSGERGRAGAIVDPKTFVDGKPNGNNTVNRLQLQQGVPSTFYVTIVVDQSADHAPSQVEVRGNAGPLDDPTGSAQIEPDRAASMQPDGVPDLVVYRVDGFVGGDYLKVSLRGTPVHAGSFVGLLFDIAEPQPRGAASRSTSQMTRSATTRAAGTSAPS
jgi:hypothetical protein